MGPLKRQVEASRLAQDITMPAITMPDVYPHKGRYSVDETSESSFYRRGSGSSDQSESSPLRTRIASAMKARFKAIKAFFQKLFSPASRPSLAGRAEVHQPSSAPQSVNAAPSTRSPPPSLSSSPKPRAEYTPPTSKEIEACRNGCPGLFKKAKELGLSDREAYHGVIACGNITNDPDRNAPSEKVAHLEKIAAALEKKITDPNLELDRDNVPKILALAPSSRTSSGQGSGYFNNSGGGGSLRTGGGAAED